MLLTSNARTSVFDFLNDQADTIKQKKSLKLSSFKTHLPGILLNDIIEITFQFLNSYDPPLDIEKISLASNYLDLLPLNFKLLSKNLVYLDLHNNNLSDLPAEIYELTKLEFLDLSSNKLSYLLRSKLGNLVNLKLLSLKNNKFKYLSPILGELSNLNLIEVLDNPLVLPSNDTIQRLQSQLADLDWVKGLKNYLVSHGPLIDAKVYESSNSLSTRNKNISETKTKASKAARRMGLIIKKPDDIVASDTSQNQSDQNQESHAALAFPSSSSSIDSSFNLVSPPPAVGTVTASTALHSYTSSSPPITPTLNAAQNRPGPSTSISSTNSSVTSLARPRSRSNTLIEIDRILENSDTAAATEHKLEAYFKRLSTLAEVPVDEPEVDRRVQALQHSTDGYGSSSSSRNGSLSNSRYPPASSASSDAEDYDTQPSTITANSNLHNRSLSNSNVLGKTPPALKTNNSILSDHSPSRKQSIGTDNRVGNESRNIVEVSRKILFAFSELHSSVRRFSGFCSDKKVTIKMVSYLYTAKANIDSLVENLELAEENSNNEHKMTEALSTCIQSFKSIMSLLSGNFLAFVNKIDVCFIRMLYLTVYGSFNELFNAYRILVPDASYRSYDKPKSLGLSINTNIGEKNDEMDLKLYESIDIATAKAQDVFGELTRAINKSAIASANSDAGPESIEPHVAQKVRELTNICVSSLDIIKRIKTKLITIRNNPSLTTKKLFWDDINLFLKAIIQTFSAVKNLMVDLPILNEIRSSMATLTKSTKDVTILLEASSYKTMPSDVNGTSNTHPPPLSSIPSVSNIFTPLSAHPSASHVNLANHFSANSHSQLNLSQQASIPPVRTPLVAALGPAAQAILPLNSDHNQPPPLTLMQSHLAGVSSPLASPPIMENAPMTAPAQSSGQYFANNGMNPFDGLILASRDRDNDKHLNN